MKRFLAAVLVAVAVTGSASAYSPKATEVYFTKVAANGIAEEALIIYDDGCGHIIAVHENKNPLDHIRQAEADPKWSGLTYTGPCVDGLRDGEWKWTDSKTGESHALLFMAGHQIFGSTTVPVDNKLFFVEQESRYWGTRSVYIHGRADENPPAWASSSGMKLPDRYGIGGDRREGSGVSIYGNGNFLPVESDKPVATWTLHTVVAYCSDYYLRDLDLKGCSKSNPHLVHVFKELRQGVSWSDEKWHACPKPKTAEGCEAKWNELSSPILALAATIARDEEARLRANGAAVVAQLPALRAAAAAKAKAEEEIRIAAAEKAAREAAERAAAQARALAEAQQKAAAAEKAAADLRKKLKAAKPGDLYVMAEDAKAAGRTDDAREAFKAILTNHPNSPLAAQAATQLSALGGSVSGGGAAGYSSSASEYGYELTDEEICRDIQDRFIETWLKNPAAKALDDKNFTDAIITPVEEALNIYLGSARNRLTNAAPVCKGLRQDTAKDVQYRVDRCERAKANAASYGYSANQYVCSPKYSGPPEILQELEAQISAASSIRSGSGSSSAAITSSSAPPSVCEQKLAAYGQSIAGLSPEPKAPTIDQFRMALWFLDGNLGVLKQHCSNDPKHGPTIAGLQRSRDEAFNSCKQVSTIPDGSACSPLDPRDAKPFDPLAGLPPIPPKK